MNASRLGGIIALVLAPALAQTYFPDVGKFTFQQGLDGDWLYIDYKYTNPGGWLRNDDAVRATTPPFGHPSRGGEFTALRAPQKRRGIPYHLS